MPGQHQVAIGDPLYPALLMETRDPPPLLHVRGDPEMLSLPQLAIVGSRHATPQARQTAHDFAAYMARRGFVITSGLAEGVDAAAHEGALAAGGTTIAVCGTGLDVVFPAKHASLARRIVGHGGALVSELPPDTGARRHQFPLRNRIIAGLSVGTLVVEAGMRSGALITARQAAEAGREVFAIPGSIHNPLTRGCHRLIRQGAKLVESAADILEELGGVLGAMITSDARADDKAAAQRPKQAPTQLPGPEYETLLDAMGWDPVELDLLVQRCGLTTAELSSMLLILEMHGLVRSIAGGRYQRSAITGE